MRVDYFTLNIIESRATITRYVIVLVVMLDQVGVRSVARSDQLVSLLRCL